MEPHTSGGQAILDRMKTMRNLLLLLLGFSCEAYTSPNAKLFSQKSVVQQTLWSSSMMTRRDPIRMPSQTPQVPYMVCSLKSVLPYAIVVAKLPVSNLCSLHSPQVQIMLNLLT